MRICNKLVRPAVAFVDGASRRTHTHAGEITRHGTRLHMDIYSARDGSPPDSRPAIIFLHGLLGSATNFRSVLLQPSISPSDHTHIYALDLPNHGRSGWTHDQMTMHNLADAVWEALRRLPHRSYILVGHSLGGKVACAMALTHPRACVGVCAMDIAPAAYPTQDAQWRAVANVVEVAADFDLRPHRTRGSVDAALAPRIPDAGMRSFLQQNLVNLPAGGYAWRVNLPIIRASMPALAAFPFSDAMQGSRVPAAFVVGGLSQFVKPAHRADIEKWFPSNTLHTIPGAGHWLHADKPKDTVEALSRILREMLARGQG